MSIYCYEPERPTLSDAIHYLKLSFAKRLRSRKGTIESRSFWQKRYYDRNVRDEREFSMKLRYLHRNPVKRGLVTEPAEWKWSSFRHYALREVGIVEIESEWTARDRETQAHAGPARVFLNPGKRPKPWREPGAPGVFTSMIQLLVSDKPANAGTSEFRWLEGVSVLSKGPCN